MRTLNELYQLAYDNFDTKYNNSGLCHYFLNLAVMQILDANEYNLLNNHFHDQRPVYSFWFWKRKNSTFPKDYLTPTSAYYWRRTPDGDKQRKLFLKYLLEKTSKDSVFLNYFA